MVPNLTPHQHPETFFFQKHHFGAKKKMTFVLLWEFKVKTNMLSDLSAPQHLSAKSRSLLAGISSVYISSHYVFCLRGQRMLMGETKLFFRDRSAGQNTNMNLISVRGCQQGPPSCLFLWTWRFCLFHLSPRASPQGFFHWQIQMGPCVQWNAWNIRIAVQRETKMCPESVWSYQARCYLLQWTIKCQGS